MATARWVGCAASFGYCVVLRLGCACVGGCACVVVAFVVAVCGWDCVALDGCGCMSIWLLRLCLWLMGLVSVATARLAVGVGVYLGVCGCVSPCLWPWLRGFCGWVAPWVWL